MGLTRIILQVGHCDGQAERYDDCPVRGRLVEVCHDHSLTVVAQKRLVDFTTLTEPRASVSGPVNLG